MRRSFLYVACLPLFVACGAVPDDEAALGDVESTVEALTDPASVLGFENAAEWTSTQGIKTSSTTTSQGAASLAISNFTFTSVSSVPLSTLPNVSSTLAFDVRLPAAVGWGQVQLFLNSPTLGYYEKLVGTATLVGLPAGSFRTLSFAVPADVQQKLRSAYSDLRFKITVNAPQTTQQLLVDNLRFVHPTITAQKIEIEVTGVDDAVYAFVDGFRRQTWRIDDPKLGTRVDATPWFASGTHALRLQAMNTGGPVSYGIRVYADDALVLDAQCPLTLCDGTDKDQGILFDQTLQFSTPSRPAAQPVNVTSAVPGKIYIENVYTGRSTTGNSTPVTFLLPPQTYTIGLGTSTEAPPVYTGEYREETVTVGASPVNVSLTSAPLPTQNTTSIVVVPIRRTVVDPTGQVGVLTNEDITSFEAQVFATRDQWLEPFSYGLDTWDVTFRPAVEDVPVYVNRLGGSPDTDAFLRDAGLTSLRQDYEIVLFFWGFHDVSGNGLSQVDASAYGGGGQVWMNTSWTRRTDWPHLGVNPALLHEVLHNYEGYNYWELGYYNGIDGLHGDNEHGYYSGQNGELDFGLWQRIYMRGQGAELIGMRQNLNQPAPSPTADVWVGVFDTIRRGYDPTPPTPAPALAGRVSARASGVSAASQVVRCEASPR